MKNPAGECLTMSVEKAGLQLGLCRNASYDAARRGDIPVLRIGKRMLVPIAAFNAMLEIPAKKREAA